MIKITLLTAARKRDAIKVIASRDEARRETRLANSWDLAHIPAKGQQHGMKWDLTNAIGVTPTPMVYPEGITFRVK